MFLIQLAHFGVKSAIFQKYMHLQSKKVFTYSVNDPLPVGYYFHSKYRNFRFNLFRDGANYVGHELMVPNVGDYRVLEIMDDQYILLRKEDNKCVMLSNICRHQQARLIDPKNRPGTDHRSGNIKSFNQAGLIICPVHKWSYKPDGKLHHAPKFENSLNLCLPVMELKSWNGMLFYTERNISEDLANLGYSEHFDPRLLDMNNYIYVGSDKPVCYNFSWERFIAVYLDLYHVAPYHPRTFAQIIDCHDFKWELGERYNVQIGWWLTTPGQVPEDLPYRKLWNVINKHYAGSQPPHGTLWVLLFPGVMIEWYPHILVISTIKSVNHEKCINYVEYYAPKDWYFYPEIKYEQEILLEAKNAYKSSAIEDAEICQTMQDSYRNMWDSGEHFVGPYNPHLELGIEHFVGYIKKEWQQKYDSTIKDLKKYR